MQAERTPVERKYALTKVEQGDYLLPSNDGRSIFRIARYRDWPPEGEPRDERWFWGAWRWDGSFVDGTAVDTGEWDRWNLEAPWCETRDEAIREALRLG
jgi:hypothetical protein